MTMGRKVRLSGAALIAALGFAAMPTGGAFAQDKKPNIIVIMGDDVGWENIGAYH
jgi:ABC-type sugar transport system substrate-binding protein